jgi:hypothetical protein
MSSGTFCDRPASTEPITKMMIETCTSSFLLNRSDSLPHTGVDTVMARREAVTTHVYWVCDPSRSAMIVGSAFDTIVELMMAVNSAASRPTSTSMISRCVYAVGAGEATGFVADSSSCMMQPYIGIRPGANENRPP